MSTSHELVVVVDDDPSMSQAVQRLLQAAGLKAVAFASAEALLASGAAEEAGCFIFDIQLDGLSGFDLRHRLLGLGVQAPVIFITAYDQPSFREQASEFGAAGYFSKPFPGRDLLNTITQAMGAA